MKRLTAKQYSLLKNMVREPLDWGLGYRFTDGRKWHGLSSTLWSLKSRGLVTLVHSGETFDLGGESYTASTAGWLPTEAGCTYIEERRAAEATTTQKEG